MTRPDVTRPWHGVLVATALPLRADLTVDFDRYAEHVAWLAAQGCQGVTPNGSLGEYQTLSPEERARETMAIQLRRCEGIERTGFHTQTGFSLDSVAGPALRRHVELGFLEDDRDCVRLTQRGKFVADAVISGLM